ncbi:cupin domain-containing protein [Vibrio sp. JC009]|uniref:cupin domain-containing protein n=1 Tax=Vibrio sp. JC009 TaxID=2912314 RepID=UPI0023B0769E|nr:cupin domain-containing protein [Vibrio sp. JC009]WED23361.1 cupin domain-containing protein [Vibrio sp. JC009]
MKMKENVLVAVVLLLACVLSRPVLADGPKVQKVTLDDAKQYSPPGHFKMTAAGLHNEAVGRSKAFGIGISVFEPGGGAESNSEGPERVYFVLEGQLTITTPDGDIVLNQFESIYRPAGAECGIINKSDKLVKMLVVGPPRPKS